MLQKPSIGRIVHYTAGTEKLAGIITKVWSDTCVNLTLFSPIDVPYLQNSVSYGTGLHQWQWPERI